MNVESTIRIDDISLLTSNRVFIPRYTTEKFIHILKNDYADFIKGRRILDMGSGTGILSVQCGLLGAAQVIATDLNPDAITLTRRNWQHNHLPAEQLQLFESNGFLGIPSTLQQHIDLIISNPPSQPRLSDMFSVLEVGNLWNETENHGRGLFDHIIDYSPDWLSPNGKLLIVATSRTKFSLTQQRFETALTQGRFASWQVVFEMALQLYEYQQSYIAFWLKAQAEDGEVRIYKQGEDYFNTMMLLEANR